MLPLMLAIENTPIAVIGNGFAAAMRLRTLDESGAGNVDVFADDPSEDLKSVAGSRLLSWRPAAVDFERAKYKIVYIADFSEEESAEYAALAHDHGALVNVHDIKALCDFHMPARLVRGDLQVTVSTNGKAAGLARILRDHLANKMFGPDWAARVTALGHARDSWRANGASFQDLIKHTETFVTDRGWLNRPSNPQTFNREG